MDRGRLSRVNLMHDRRLVRVNIVSTTKTIYASVFRDVLKA